LTHNNLNISLQHICIAHLPTRNNILTKMMSPARGVNDESVYRLGVLQQLDARQFFSNCGGCYKNF
jgi:hypothetical protein